MGSSKFVMQKSVYTVPSDGSVTITSTTPTSVVLTGPVPATVVAGWSLVGNVAGKTQFLRKVTSVTNAGNVHTFQTTAAQLTDLLNDAQISQVQTIAATTLATMQPAQPGITIKSLTATRDIAYSNEIAFDKVAISDAGGLNSVGEINGKIDYSFGFETALDVGVHGVFDLRPKINKFRVAPFLKANGQLTVTGKTSGSFSKQIPIGLPITFPVASIGPVPVNLGLQFLLEIDGRLDVNGNISVTGSIDMSAGVDCTDDVWSTVQTFDHSFSVTPPNVAAQATLNFSAVQPQVTVSIPDIGSLYVKADVLKAGITFAYQSQPSGYNITTTGDFKFTAGATIQLGPITAYDGPFGDFDLGAFLLGKPTFIGSNGKGQGLISYWYINNFSDREIFTMNTDGTNAHSVLNNPTKDQYQPDLSHDAKQLCYGNKGSLWVCDATGQNDHEIVDASVIQGDGLDYPTWSPDDTQIAYNAGSGAYQSLYLVSSTGGTPQKVSDLPYGSFQPRFSPDGTKLVYAYRNLAGTYQIYQLNLATKQSTLLVSSGNYNHPSYSPDGKNIVFTDASTGFLYISDTGGVGVTQLRNDDYYSIPRFSPDGTQILWGKGYGSGSNVLLGTCDLQGNVLNVFTTDLGNGGEGYASWQIQG